MGQGEVQNWIRSRPDQEARQQSSCLIGWLGFAIPSIHVVGTWHIRKSYYGYLPMDSFPGIIGHNTTRDLFDVSDLGKL